MDPHLATHLVDEEGLSVWEGNMKIYSSFKAQLTELFWKRKAHDIICMKYGWESCTFHAICWDALEKAMQLMAPSLRVRISKFITRTLPVGSIMEQRHQWKHSFCPRCGYENESPYHIL